MIFEEENAAFKISRLKKKKVDGSRIVGKFA